MARIVGINRTQDASISLLDKASAVSLQKERITRKKHHWGRLQDVDLYRERVTELRQPIDLIVECYSSDPEMSKRLEYRAELQASFGDCPVSEVSHHLAHAYSAFVPSAFDEAAVMVVDCQGSPLNRVVESWRRPDSARGDWLEVASFYHFADRKTECIDKHVWDCDRTRPVGLGAFYLLLTDSIFPGGEGQEGKVMGLAPYGDPLALKLPDLVVIGHEVFIPKEWGAVLVRRGNYRYSDHPAQFQKAADLAAAGQRAFENALLALAGWLHERTRSKRLCFAGGVALNCVANGRLLREGPFSEIFIPPAPHDGGTALGCAIYGAIEVLGEETGFSWTSDFLGPSHDSCRTDVFTKYSDVVVETPESLPDCVAQRLASGQVVAVFHGRSESGPRALGHRSLLADPRSVQIKDWINSRIKGRELFRPLAPIVLEDEGSEYFDIDRPLPFMQFAAPVKEKYRDLLPAITHVDGSARVQTVSAKNDELLHRILTSFRQRTGCPVLINTSLNGPGEPIVETLDEALELLLQTPIDTLISPPFVVCKKSARDGARMADLRDSQSADAR